MFVVVFVCVARCSLFVVRCLFFVAYRAVCVVCCSLFAAGGVLCVV